jgi:RimJ/RimL family protein N-acetyltransferase
MLHYFTNTPGISKFVALIEPDNHGSRGVARNTGFIESGWRFTMWDKPGQVTRFA